MAWLALVSGASAAEPLRGQWHLDQSIDMGINYVTPDSSGNGIDLTTTDQIPLVPGKFGLATAITAQDQVPQSLANQTPIKPTAGITLLAWVKRSGNPGSLKTIAGLGSDFPCTHAAYQLHTSTGLQFSYWDGTQVKTSPVAGNSVWDGKWHLVAGTLGGSRVRLYVDGVQVGNGTPSTQPIDYNLGFSDLFAIGDYPYLACADPDRRFPGNIDEVRVYSRALTAAELDALIPKPAPPPQPPPECPAGTSPGVTCQTAGGVTTVTGTQGDDTIVATGSGQKIDGGGGNDTIDCRKTKQLCSGGSGQDKLNCARATQMRCEGGAGSDKLDCKASKGGLCDGGSGNDKLNCQKGQTKCKGDSGKDSLNCLSGKSKETCSGGASNDKLNCQKGQMKCKGDSGKDSLNCSSGKSKETCSGGSGSDKLNCQKGQMTCSGGSGNDKLDCDLAKSKAKCTGGAGHDKVDCSTGAAHCTGGKGPDLVLKR